jgi:hypothetical protein
MVKVFISYSRKDRIPADLLSQWLRSNGVEVFLDYEEMLGTDNFPERLAKEINTCDFLLLLLSKSSASSRWVRREVEYADERQKKIVIVILEDSELPDALFYLRRSDHLDGRLLKRRRVDLKLTAKLSRTLGVSTIQSPGQRAMRWYASRPLLVVLARSVLFLLLIFDPSVSFSPPSLNTIIDQFVFSAEGRIYYQERGGENRSWIISGDVPNARQPRFSPDGARVAFIGSDFNGVDQIFVTAIEAAARPEQITGTEYAKNCLSWIDEDSFEITTPMETGFAIRFINFGNRTERSSERFPYGVYESCYSYPTGDNHYVVYSRREVDDADIYLRDLDTGMDYAVTSNDVDDLMPGIGGRDMFMYYREIAGSEPVAYELMWLWASGIFGHKPETLPFPVREQPGLFETRRLSRIVWGGSAGGRAIALGIERTDATLSGAAIFDTENSSGQPLQAISSFSDATDPDWRQRQQ